MQKRFTSRSAQKHSGTHYSNYRDSLTTHVILCKIIIITETLHMPTFHGYRSMKCTKEKGSSMHQVIFEHDNLHWKHFDKLVRITNLELAGPCTKDVNDLLSILRHQLSKTLKGQSCYNFNIRLLMIWRCSIGWILQIEFCNEMPLRVLIKLWL